MEASYQNVERPISSKTSPHSLLESKSSNKCRCLLCAVNIIILIGSLVAAGCLYSQLGYTSFAIGGAGIILSLLGCLLNRHTCCRAKDAHNAQPNRQDLPDPTTHALQSQTRSDPISLDASQLGIPKTKTEEPQAQVNSTSQMTVPPKKTEIKVPDLPPLPPIFNLELDAFHPLSKAFSSDQFSRQSEADAKKKSVEIPDFEFLDIPLSFWINQNPNVYDAQRYLQMMSDPTRKHLVEMTNQRIQEFDQTIQLKERVARLKNSVLTVNALLPAWITSPLRLSLLLDDELNSLKVSSIAQLDNVIVWDALDSRLKELSRKKQDCVLPENFTKKSIERMLLVDLHKLKAQQIHTCPTSFPPITFLLIDFSELKQIKTDQLSAEQLNLIFSARYFNEKIQYVYYVQLLTAAQINACISQIKNKRLFIHLSEEQAVEFDFSQLDKEIFNIIFDQHCAADSIAAQVFPKLNLNRIYELSPWFFDKHWKAIGDVHSLALDFTKIVQSKREHVFKLLFSVHCSRGYSQAEKLFPRLSLDQIYALTPLFSEEHWKAIGDAHACAFDFLRLPEAKRKTVFGIIFSTYPTSYSPADTLFPRLSLDQIYALTPLFSDAHWRAIGDAHTIAFDFSKIAESERKKVLNILFSTYSTPFSKADQLLPKLSFEQLESIRPYLSPEALKCRTL